MKKFAAILFSFLILGLISFNYQKGFVITGHVTGFTDGTKISIINFSTEDTIETTTISNNKFVFKGFLKDEPEEVMVIAKTDNPFTVTCILIGNEDVTIRGDIKDFQRSLTISGSRFQDDYTKMNSVTRRFDLATDSLSQWFMKLPLDQRQKQNDFFNKLGVLSHTRDSLRLSYAKANLNTYPALIELFNRKARLPKDTLRTLFHKLSANLKASKYGKALEVYLNAKIPEIGDPYLNFEGYTKNNEKIRLSDIKGKYILLDFTAAYCGACVLSGPELRKIAKTYNDSLTIVSFSSDAKKEIWLKALQRDSVTWTSIWDGKGVYSDTYIKYGIKAIPSFFLIDPNGKIVDKWLGYYNGWLEEKLKRFKK